MLSRSGSVSFGEQLRLNAWLECEIAHCEHEAARYLVAVAHEQAAISEILVLESKFLRAETTLPLVVYPRQASS